MAQILTVNKWGNSLAIRIPGYVARSMDLEPGDKIKLFYKDNYILLEVDKSNEQQFEQWLELFGRGEAPADFSAWQKTIE